MGGAGRQIEKNEGEKEDQAARKGERKEDIWDQLLSYTTISGVRKKGAQKERKITAQKEKINRLI